MILLTLNNKTCTGTRDDLVLFIQGHVFLDSLTNTSIITFKDQLELREL